MNRLFSLRCMLATVLVGFIVASVADSAVINSYDTQKNSAVNPKPGPFKAQKLGDVAFVRDGGFMPIPAKPGQVKPTGKIVFNNAGYPLDLDGVVGLDKRFDTVDSVFQVCYGGAYVDPFVAASAAGLAPANYTVTAATGWFQTARNDDNFHTGEANNKLRNFTNNWRLDTVTGMKEHFQAATAGAPYTPVQNPFDAKTINYAIYASPDSADPMQPHPNDDRKVADAVGGRQFVLLSQWSIPNYRRYAINTLRMYDMLTRKLDIPANQIATLFGNPQIATLGPFAGPINDDPNGLLPPPGPMQPNGNLATTASNIQDNWLKAIKGDYFLDNMGQKIQPAEGDKLLIYHTGHGGLNTKFEGVIISTGTQEDYLLALDEKYNLHALGSIDEDSSIADFDATSGQFMHSIQLSFDAPLPAATQLYVNGQLMGLASSTQITDPSLVLPVDDFIANANYHYDFTVPQSLLGTNEEQVNFSFVYPSSLETAFGSLVAIDLWGGDQELLVAVPEPAGWLLVLAACVVFWARLPHRCAVRRLL